LGAFAAGANCDITAKIAPFYPMLPGVIRRRKVPFIHRVANDQSNLLGLPWSSVHLASEANMKIVVVGAGFVGLVTGACFAGHGHDVVCVETNPSRLAMVKRGEPPFFEPGLPELLTAGLASGKFSIAERIDNTVDDCDLVFIAVGTPNAEERIDLSQIEAAARSIGAAIARSKSYTVVVVKSTVVPGTTAGPIRAALEQSSGMVAGKDFGLCMNPEFLRQGVAVDDFMHSDRLVLGAIDERSGAALLRAYAGFDCPKLQTTLQNAEMSKYTSNVLLATLISFSNEIASICERMPLTDVEFVMDALSLDRRLSPIVDGKRVSPEILGYLRAGSGFGGSCLPKDISALRQTARDHDIAPRLMDAVISVNAGRPANLLKIAERSIGGLSGRKVALLGLTFKPGTDDLRDSPALSILKLLLDAGSKVAAFDPLVDPQARAGIDPRADVVGAAEDALKGADIAIIATAWPEFAALDWTEMSRTMARPVVVDGRNLLRKVTLPAEMKYFRVGRFGEAETALT
jgi:UDPglucose 6-dehydrogenase/GDP-mannose 6-dehydrogenase